jgi:hypothetical protein
MEMGSCEIGVDTGIGFERIGADVDCIDRTEVDDFTLLARFGVFGVEDEDDEALLEVVADERFSDVRLDEADDRGGSDIDASTSNSRCRSFAAFLLSRLTVDGDGSWREGAVAGEVGVSSGVDADDVALCFPLRGTRFQSSWSSRFQSSC